MRAVRAAPRTPSLLLLAITLGIYLQFAVVVIAAVGLSRVYFNVHYLTDVVAGWAAGTAWLVAVLLVVHVVEHGWRTRRDAGA